MRLESMWVHGLRRFGGDKPHKLRLDNKLVCIIGANEAGKSTLLDAMRMSHLDQQQRDDEGAVVPVSRLLLSRGEDIPDDRELVRVRYRLDDDDRAVLATLPSAAQLRDVVWYERVLTVDGYLASRLDPAPERDKTARHALAGSLAQAIQNEWPTPDELEGTPADAASLSGVIDALDSKRLYLGSKVLQALSNLADWLEETGGQDWGLEDAGLIQKIRESVELESLKHPTDQAYAVLEARIPRFVLFDKGDRGVGDEYELAELDRSEPLVNLAALAQLDLDLLYRKMLDEETGTVEDLVQDANRRLAVRFGAWSQKPPVEVSFGYSGTRLFVHVRSGIGPRMRLGERSEGLRQFVALVALTAQQSLEVPPVLLIDEVEMHLHYDAQADLVAVLAEQETAPQVVYTTHSAASLPEDLGSAVRVIEGVGDSTASRIRQHFWADTRNLSLMSLLMAMGAGSLSLVLLRPAALVEGGSDLVLLPSLMREATKGDSLGFQVVPGGAEIARERITGQNLQGTSTIWIYDGDQGGQEARDFLVSQGVPRERILLLHTRREPLDLEDLIDPDTYVEAINAYGRDVGAGDRQVTTEDLPTETCRRHKRVERWFLDHELKPPSKVAVANKVLDLRGTRRLLDPKRRATIAKLHRDALAIFEADAAHAARPE
jgi:hypothetical protein